MNQALHSRMTHRTLPLSSAVEEWLKDKQIANAELTNRLLDSHPIDLPVLPTVVVVDDEPTVAVTLAEILVRHKLDAVWFIHPGEALEFLQRTKVNLLLTDINMPHADGISLAECVHAIQPTCFLFLFSASAHDPSVRDRVEKSGLPVYLEAKPLHPRYLVETIHTMLSRMPHPSTK